MYGADLAFIHDDGYGDVARQAAPVLLDALRRGGLDRGLVAELGCGSGIFSGAIAAAGYDVLGYDFSPAMIALARQRVPQARFRRQSLWAAELPRCVAVAAVGECFNYQFDAANTDTALAALFRRVQAALVPGGVFLFDAAAPGRVPPPGTLRAFREGDGWAVLVDMQEDAAQRTLTRHITSFRRVGNHYRRDREVHRLRLLRRPELAAELRALGFRVRALPGYGAGRFPPGYFALLARKPGRGGNHAR